MTAQSPGASLFEAEHVDYRESVRTFLAREAVPAYADWRAARDIPRDVLRTAGQHGFLGMGVGEEHGGAGVQDPRFGAIVGEEAMRAGVPGLALVLTAHNDVAVPAILRGAPADRRDAWLPGLASGELVATVVDTPLAWDGAGAVSGEAPFVVNAAAADLLIVVARRGEDEVAAAVVEAGAPGLVVTPSDSPIGLDAAGLGTAAFAGAPAVELEGGAQAVAVDHLLSLAITAWAGGCAALDIAVEYTSDRKAFGQPIAAFQNTRQMLAAVHAELQAAGALVTDALRRHVGGALGVADASSAKLFCAGAMDHAVDAGLQLHGGYGYIMEYPIAHAYADARFWRLHGATDQDLRDVIGRSLFD